MTKAIFFGTSFNPTFPIIVLYVAGESEVNDWIDLAARGANQNTDCRIESFLFNQMQSNFTTFMFENRKTLHYSTILFVYTRTNKCNSKCSIKDEKISYKTIQRWNFAITRAILVFTVMLLNPSQSVSSYEIVENRKYIRLLQNLPKQNEKKMFQVMRL